MTTNRVRNLPALKLEAAIEGVQAQTEALGAAGVLVHYDVRDAITTADASSEATSVALANAIKAAYNLHRADTDEHAAADATNAVSSADATALASAITLLNEIKTDFNAHLLLGAGTHRSVPIQPAVSTANASDQTTANALANALKLAVNRHFGSGAPDLEIIGS